MYTIIDAGKVVAESLGPFNHPNGMNEHCLQAKEWTTPRGVSYRVEIIDAHRNLFGYKFCPCWTAYKLRRLSYGVSIWEKIPCSTRADENAFPYHVAMVGQRMVEGYGKESPQLELAL